jgi:tRNA nucleotidyltransferase (CCA-adding enzyme)
VDFDLTVLGNAIEAAHTLCAFDVRFRLLATFPEFGTAQVSFKDEDGLFESIDLASTRQETYANCGSLPTVTYLGVSLLDDAQRRDFTLNTLALDVHGNLIDPTGEGLSACQARRLDVLYDQTFQDDPTRILRGFGLASRLNMTFSPHTETLIRTFLTESASIYSGGGDRVRTALLKWFQTPETAHKHELLKRWLLWGGLSLWDARIPHPEDISLPPEWFEILSVLDREGLLTPDHRALIYWLSLWAQTPLSCHEGLLEKLEARRDERQAAQALLTLMNDNAFISQWTNAIPQEDPVAIVSLIEQVPFVAFVTWLALMPASEREPTPEPSRRDVDRVSSCWQTHWAKVLKRYLHEWADVQSPLTPRQLMAAGIPEGPEIMRLQSALRHARLRGEILNESEALAWLNRFV